MQELSQLRMKSTARCLPIPQGVIFLDMSSGACYEFNKVGAVIAMGIKEGKSTADIVTQLQNKFGVTTHRVEKDVEEFVDKLLKKGLVEIQSPEY